MADRLLDEAALTRSAVVANCAMNRERQLAGPNSYARELGFHPVDRLRSALALGSGAPAPEVGWLDLCCGRGRALRQAAEQLRAEGLAHRVALVGVDLVDYFDPAPAPDPPPRLVCASVTEWAPTGHFDLITCVHGLHYVGDKLAVLARAAGWLTDTGLLVADLDLASIRRPDGSPVGRSLGAALRRAGFRYDARRRRISLVGRREVALPYTYLGADDRAGPNYTRQPAVDSYYAPH
ncbi:MAG TPA: methyltransferase domain-containing protein [Pilimelia sp.]|nr:methyltransferase domain-containing protein [Pilimelia sp.]